MELEAAYHKYINYVRFDNLMCAFDGPSYSVELKDVNLNYNLETLFGIVENV